MSTTPGKVPKLTKAQQDLYDKLPCTCVEYYAPAKRLVELGLAKFVNYGFSARLVKNKS